MGHELAAQDREGHRRGRQRPLVNEEAEISEVIRRRRSENLGREKTQKIVARAYADRARGVRTLTPEWTSVDTSTD